jgi:hypothetical protein
MKINHESPFTLTVSSPEKLYSLENDNILVVAHQRIKTVQVSFWTEEEWAKNIEKQNKILKKAQDRFEKNFALNNRKETEESK